MPARCPIGQRSGRCWTVSVLAGPSCRACLRADGPAPLWHAGTPSRPAWRSGPSGSLARPAMRLPHRSACCRYGEGYGHQGGTSARRRWPGTSVGLWPWGPADARRAVRYKSPLINRPTRRGNRDSAVPSSSADQCPARATHSQGSAPMRKIGRRSPPPRWIQSRAARAWRHHPARMTIGARRSTGEPGLRTTSAPPRCPRTAINSQQSPPAATCEREASAGFEPASNARGPLVRRSPERSPDPSSYGRRCCLQGQLRVADVVGRLANPVER
jgi:hypothetical protein